MLLNLTSNFKDPDEIYDALIKAHEGLSKDESDTLNARLVLILANHIGDQDIFEQALKKAAHINEKLNDNK